MYLKRLELLGFKSFASKTTLEFGPGVTAIVGPNGSGKSNVTDALRWVLGETSAKSIRADRSENLIFSGTLKRGAANFAQVTMTLDNSSGFYPIDYAEVNIRRRVKRDGTSNYYLNDSEVRLKDIVDFFAQVRLGTKGFAIINQGSSDMFIKASPVERRVMLEEVLGLRQYQIKRHDAENKLNSTERNLTEARSRTEELLPHLRMLRRQTKKWERHDALKAELDNLEQQFFGAKLAVLEAEKNNIAPELATLEEKIKSEGNELKERQAKLAEVEKSQPEPDQNFDNFREKQNQLQDKKNKFQKDLARLEVELEFLSRRASKSATEDDLLRLVNSTQALVKKIHTSDDISFIKQELQKLDEEIQKTLNGSSQESDEKAKQLKNSMATIASDLQGLESELKEISNHEYKITDALRSFNAKFKVAYEAVEQSRQALSSLENQKNRLTFETSRIAEKISELAHMAQQSGRRLEEFRSQEIASDQNIDSLERKMLSTRGELASIGDIDEAMIKEAKEMEERFNFLSKQIEDLETATSDLKNLIKDLKKKVYEEFQVAVKKVNEELSKHFEVMFGGGKAKLILDRRAAEAVITDQAPLPEEEKPSKDARLDSSQSRQDVDEFGLEIELSLPRKNIKGLDMLSGGERSLVSIAILFALISVSPPPFLVLDEIDAALDEANTKRFSNLVKEFSRHSQFIIVTHNRSTMHSASVLYGVTMDQDGTSKMLSVKFEAAKDFVKKP
ncbi:MAG: hypothetical protein COU10_00250 [Candidatus Harrisonbacteria bacterium CG10_big_fil_rev_8_21_14_0_10_45_28]|uniref:RecF/RecN/SMC N-terminal domain-containing protein n=1 Tax=Candidatus Harrisonbacteria bacterium CG10_big_fil_rev_8_21_14_0_10_45_28 TaxID=1974586 RepID=A0A2H0UPD7_9BACT|nr:MAG: hypothetical protein COU10_00250 [Candidatus Harrisonbacteria bacterium CG10_big_fil_rev_8_21_14_0_10_45_28]